MQTGWRCISPERKLVFICLYGFSSHKMALPILEATEELVFSTE